MRKQLLDQLAQAAYNARLAALTTGAYPKRAFQLPSSDQYYTWDDLNERQQTYMRLIYQHDQVQERNEVDFE